MKKIAQNIDTRLLGLMIIIVSSFLNENTQDIVHLLTMIIYAFVLILSIFSNAKNHLKRETNEQHFFTLTNLYSKVTQITLGATGLSVCYIFWKILTNIEVEYILIGSLFSTLILINGLTYFSSNKLKIDNSEIQFFGEKEYKIEINSLSRIEILDNVIVFEKNEYEKEKIEDLELSKKWKFKISEYLKSKIDRNRIEIIFGNTA